MKQLFFVFSFFSIYFSFSQNLHKEFLDKTIVELKKESKIDSKDFRAYDLLESFYNEVLQSDNGELTAETSKKIETYIVKDKIPNNHLLVLFLMYQEHITQALQNNERINSEYQIACVNLLENEINAIYSKIPALIYIYKFEALSANDNESESKRILFEGLKKYPNSIPLKVYFYLSSSDNSLKKDLIENHKNHWMIKQFDIK